MQGTRELVYNALMNIDNNGSYSNIVLDSILVNNELSATDKRFISALFYGVLERKLTLDYIIGQYSKIKLSKIKSDVLNILRMGVYQLVYMDKVPHSAAVNESVKLAKKHKLFSAAGFINGVLRNIERADCKYTLPSEKNNLEYMSIKYSCPKSIVKLWLDAYGDSITDCILDTLSGRPPLTIRVNPLKCSDEQLLEWLGQNGITAMLHHEHCIMIENSGALNKLNLLNEGFFHVQDIASQLCAELMHVKENSVLADICAAPGGKSFTVAELMSNSGTVYAYDLHQNRVKLIRDGAKRLGLSCIRADVRDALSDTDIDMKADYVLCDVPCSGLGVLRRKPEIRYKENTGVDDLPDIQYRILCNSAKLLKSNGVLFYSTCTLNPKENNRVAERFLDANKDFAPLSLDLPDYIERKIDEPSNCLTVIPQKNGSDGFFISAFKKQV